MSAETAEARAFRPSAALRAATAAVLIVWVIVAAFPLLWILIMSFKLPVDAFAPAMSDVILGPRTREAAGGLSAAGFVVIVLLSWIFARRVMPRRAVIYDSLSSIFPPFVAAVIGRVLVFVVVPVIFVALAVVIIGAVQNNLPQSFLTRPLIGFTFQHYYAVWAENRFYVQFINSAVITGGVVCLSLVVGAGAGYALARSRSSVAFWLLTAALVFRAMPHSVLVAGYLQPFIDYGLYGRHLAVIIVLAAINQPFTIWMLRSFFANIPAELDEAAMVDGCSHFQAFRRVIVPVMWPGIITAGLFSFLLAYNDYLVTALLLDGDSMTMVPSIARYFNRETTMTDQVEAVAAAISITAPLFFLVMVFQRHIVSGLVQGAVKI